MVVITLRAVARTRLVAIVGAGALSLKADLDRMDMLLFDAGDFKAFERISSRAAAFHAEPVAGESRESARVKADRDYMDAAIRIAERQ